MVAWVAWMVGEACRVSPQVRRFVIRRWYQYLNHLDREALMIFMNYGYAALDDRPEFLMLRAEDLPNRFCIQLYHHVAGAIDLTGREVLEVGCGRGGGAAYIMRYLQPKSMVGVDIAEKAVAFCTAHHRLEGLSFSQGDAEALPFDDHAFDVVVNIESSHCYGSMERFLSEVQRVLRPGGYFLFADHRPADQIPTLRQTLQAQTFTVLKDVSITANVLRALDIDNERRVALIEQKVPPLIKQRFMRFAGIKGTKTYELFRTDALEYRSFVLRK